jgi:Ca-activated chloride channel homolog
MHFAQPFWLLLLILPFALYAWQRRSASPSAALVLPPASALEGRNSWRITLRKRLPLLRWLSLFAMIIAMARPQLEWQEERVKADALDIMLALDISPSMLSKDFDPDRLSVAKRVATDFVQKRPHDRIGLVAFSAEAFTQCPLTTDHQVLTKLIRTLQIGLLEDGTAIGMGLATAVNRLQNSTAITKIVILMTDGENNAGYVSPELAAELADSLHIRVYTVGIGSGGMVLSPTSRDDDGRYSFDYRQSDFNTRLLEEIAQKTQGKFFRARSSADLADIYSAIDRLEKTKIEVSQYARTTEYFPWFLGVAMALLLIDLLLRWGVVRSISG